MTKVMRKEARHTQRRDRASGVPLEILEHPETSCNLQLVTLLPTPILRGCSWNPPWETILQHGLFSTDIESLVAMEEFKWDHCSPVNSVMGGILLYS